MGLERSFTPEHFRKRAEAQSLKQRLIDDVRRLREEAKVMGPGLNREVLLRKARQAETAAHIDEWLRSSLQSPK